MAHRRRRAGKRPSAAPAGGIALPGPALASRRLATVGAAALLFILLSCLVFWPHTPVDDAYIGFRYARNLAVGQGLVFNTGERVEGYSGLSWVLVLAAGDALGLPPPALSRWLGLLLGAGTLLLVGLSRGSGRPVAAVLLAFSLPFAYHAVNGLETALAALLLAALVLVPPDSPARRACRHAAAALLVLTRPEGLLAVLLWTAVLLLARRRLGAQRPARHDLAVVLAAALAFVAQLAFRWAYYGDWIANSARAKLLPPRLRAAGRPRRPRPLRLASERLGSVAARRGLRRHPRRTSRRRHPHRRELAAAAGARPLSPRLRLRPGGERRRQLSALALLRAAAAPLLQPGGGRVGAALARCRGASPPPAGAVGRRGSRRSRLGERRSRRPGAAPGRTCRGGLGSAIGRALGSAVPPATRLALCPVGALPYHAGLPILDMLGLTDPHIARTPPDRHYVYPGHQRHDAAYVLARRPELVLLANGPMVAARGEPFPWNLVRYYERDLATSPRFRRAYRLVHLRLPSGRYVQLFARRDAAARLDGLLP